MPDRLPFQYASWAASGGGHKGGGGILDYFQAEERKKALMQALRKTLPMRENPEQVAQTLAESGLNMEDAALVIQWHKGFDDWASSKRESKARQDLGKFATEGIPMRQVESRQLPGGEFGITDNSFQDTSSPRFLSKVRNLAMSLSAQSEKGSSIYEGYVLKPEHYQAMNQASMFQAIKDQVHADKLQAELDNELFKKETGQRYLSEVERATSGGNRPDWRTIERIRALGSVANLGGQGKPFEREPAEPMVATETGLMPRSQVRPGTKPWTAPPKEPQENPAMEDQRARGLMFKLYGASDLTGLSPDASARAGEAVQRMQQYRSQGMTTDQAANKAYRETEGIYKALKNLPAPPTAGMFGGKATLKDIQKNRIKQAMNTPGMDSAQLVDALVSQGWEPEAAKDLIRQLAKEMQ